MRVGCRGDVNIGLTTSAGSLSSLTIRKGQPQEPYLTDSSLVEKRLHALAFVDALELEGLGGDVESCRRGAVLPK